MPNFDLIIFDLDGTLVDSGKDLANSVNQMLLEFGLPTHTEEKIRTFIGNGAKKLVERSLPQNSKTTLEEALKRFKEIYGIRFLENTRFYPKVEETVLQLKDVKLGVLSNKPDVFTKALIENSSLKSCFDFVFGTDVLGSLKPDPILIEKCRGNAQKILFVGDSLVDLETAKNAKISSCIVTYGLGNLEEIKQLKPDFVIDDFSKILKIIKNP